MKPSLLLTETTSELLSLRATRLRSEMESVRSWLRRAFLAAEGSLTCSKGAGKWGVEQRRLLRRSGERMMLFKKTVRNDAI